jgi:dihydrofolate reductase
MTRVTLDLSISLDGYVAGPNPTREEPLGEGGEALHEWTVGTASWRERHGRSGGDVGRDDEIAKELFGTAGAVLMGRRMFSGGAGPWEDDPVADGWWGEEPPFRMPVFVLTHHARAPVTKQGGTSYTFVTEGIEAALEHARAEAADRDVAIAGGADIAQQYLRAGVVDLMQLHVVPLLLGGGVRLLDDLPAGVTLEVDRVVDSPRATHLRYRVGG